MRGRRTRRCRWHATQWAIMAITLAAPAGVRATCDGVPVRVAAPVGSVDAIDAVRTSAGAWVVWRDVTAESSFIRACLTDDTGHAVEAARLVEAGAVADGRACGAPRAGTDGARVRLAYEITEGTQSEVWLRTVDADAGVGAAHALGAAAIVRLPRLPQVATLDEDARHPALVAVVWTDWSRDTPALAGVWCDSLGVPLGEPAVWWAPAGGARAASVTAWGPDSIGLAWVEGEWPGRIRAGFVEAGEVSVRDAFELSDAQQPTRRSAPCLTAREGRGLCVWSEAAAGRTQIGARWLDARGTLGGPFAVAVDAGRYALSPRAALGDDGVGECAWEEGAGDSAVVGGIWLAPAGGPLAARDTLARAPHGCRTVAVIAREGNRPWFAAWGASRDTAGVFSPEAVAICADGYGLVGASWRPASMRRRRRAEVTTLWTPRGVVVHWRGSGGATLRVMDAAGRAVGDAVRIPAGDRGECDIPLAEFGVSPRRIAYVVEVPVAREAARTSAKSRAGTSSVPRE